MKRIALFVLTNLAIMAVLVVTLTVLSAVFGINFNMGGRTLNVGSLAIFSLVVGFTGAFISLLMSKSMAKWTTGAQVIRQPSNAMESWLVETVRRHAEKAGIGMPEVAVYESDEVNAFATGMSRNNALVAVSTGLLQRMTRDEAEAVLGHEVSHVANGDMVTLALIQGIVNTFVIAIARAVGWLVDRAILKNEEGPGIGYYATFFVLEIALGILASWIVMWFSRRREFRADTGGADLAGRAKMIAALERLQSLQGPPQLPERVAAFGISGGDKSGWTRFFATHPSLEDRIAALRASGGVRRVAQQPMGS